MPILGLFNVVVFPALIVIVAGKFLPNNSN